MNARGWIVWVAACSPPTGVAPLPAQPLPAQSAGATEHPAPSAAETPLAVPSVEDSAPAPSAPSRAEHRPPRVTSDGKVVRADMLGTAVRWLCGARGA